MTNETVNTEYPAIAFGARLQSARESMGLDTKDAAARLRLNEKVILMMEKERYADDLPITFVRGYIRSYGKLLQIPELEIKKALEPIKAKPTNIETEIAKKANKPVKPVTSDTYSMKISTLFIAFTMIGLVGAWWYTNNVNKNTMPSVIADSQLLQVPSDTIQSTVAPLALNAGTAPLAPAPALPGGDTQININPKSGETTILNTQPDGQTNVVVEKPATATTPATTTVLPQVKQKPKTPADDDDEQYTDDEYTD